MIDTALTLIAPASREQDANGVWRRKTEMRREILARLASIDRAEFFAAGQNGLRPDYRFTVNACEYEGETLCEYDGAQYAIYRTYRVAGTDDLELYVQRKAGVGVANGENLP